jgi:hypothetical protein
MLGRRGCPHNPHLQDFELTLDLLLLDGLQDLDDAALVGDDVEPLKHLAVLAAPDLAHHLVVILHKHTLNVGGRTPVC